MLNKRKNAGPCAGQVEERFCPSGAAWNMNMNMNKNFVFNVSL